MSRVRGRQVMEHFSFFIFIFQQNKKVFHFHLPTTQSKK